MSRMLKGRGALSNPPGRFDRTQSQSVDDGWYQDELPSSLATSVEADRARSVITTNDSPDVGFEQSINPYRGCEHGCVYCAWGGTPILMADGGARPLEALRAGDAIYGTGREGWYRRYTKTQVIAHWSVIKPAYRVRLENGTELVTGGDHRLLTERGWKFVTGAERGVGCRPHLTTGNKLMGTGEFASAVPQDQDYRRGYLCGVIRGDGMLRQGVSFPADGSGQWKAVNQFRLALCDVEALDRAQGWLQSESIATKRFAFSASSMRPMETIRTQTRLNVDRIRELIAWPSAPTRPWHAGFLAGIFDAEGSYSGGILRIVNSDWDIIGHIGEGLRVFGFDFVCEPARETVNKMVAAVRLRGGLREHLRFFHTFDPAIRRKRDITGQAVKSEAKLRVISIEPLGKAMRLYDITTGSGDFIANGVVSHNCYARPSHAYVGLSSGLDFETRLFYKPEVKKLLTGELSRPGYVCKPIAMGTNTDPYQPVEKRLQVTRQVLGVLLECRHPVTIVTKSALILRDLAVLVELARERLAAVTVSLTSLDPEIKRTLEPRTASPEARLRVIRELSSAGVPVGVLIAPVIPVLTDHELESLVEAAAKAGACSAGYVLLRLPHEVKSLFREWLAKHHPLKAQHVMSIVQELRGGRDNDPRFGTRMKGTGVFSELLRVRFQQACRRNGIPQRANSWLDTTRFRPPAASTPQLELEL